MISFPPASTFADLTRYPALQAVVMWGSGRMVGSVAKFDLWAKSKNWMSGIQ
jgi:hypothetical protein